MTSSEEWFIRIKENLKHTCNGDIEPGEFANHVVCKMGNGTISASVASDGTRMLSVKKEMLGRTQKLSMESQTNEMVITRSLSGSIEFLHRMGDSPEVRIEQVGKDGKMLGNIKINTYNPKVETTLSAYL